MSTARGRLLAFEGGEGSGKSTQAARLAQVIGARLTREPGGTTLGEQLRPVLLDAAVAIDARAEALLMAAARAQHVAEVIAPALAAGTDVVTDRFTASSLAYQGYGRGLDVDELARLSAWATGGIEPDLVFLLQVPPEVGMSRISRDRDRLESAGAEFHARVATGFADLAARDPNRWIVVDASPSADEVAARVLGAWREWEARSR